VCGIVAYIGPKTLRRSWFRVAAAGVPRVRLGGRRRRGRSGLKVRKAKAACGTAPTASPRGSRARRGSVTQRWATHGEPSDANAHPHVAGTVAVVHNGIIENADELRAKLVADGVEFSSRPTPSPRHLISRSAAPDLAEAVRQALTRSSAPTHRRHRLRAPRHCVAARNRDPVVLGSATRRPTRPPTWPRWSGTPGRSSTSTRRTGRAQPGRLSAPSTSQGARTTPKEPSELGRRTLAYDAGGHDHFMAKEIHEQPRGSSSGPCAAGSTCGSARPSRGLNLDPREAGRSAG